MRQWKIRSKMLVMAILFFIIIIGWAGLDAINEYKMNQHSLEILESNIRDDYDAQIKSQIDNLLSMIDTLQKQYASENIPIDESKKKIAAVIRDLHYGDHGYFWVDTSTGDNVVLYGSKLEGQNRYDFQDSRGKYVLHELVKKALTGGGYTDYYYPKQGEKKEQPKRAYSAYYKDFDWIVGTGIYTDDIDQIIQAKTEEYNEMQQKHLLGQILFIFIVFVSITGISAVFAKNFIEPILYASAYAESIANEKRSIVMPEKYLNRSDEVGKLVVSLKKMYQSILAVLKEKEKVNNQLGEEKEFLNLVLSSIGDGIVVTDGIGTIKQVNEAALKQLYVKKEDILEEQFSRTFYFYDEMDREIDSADYFADCINRRSETRRECFLKAYGNSIYIEDSAFPILNQQDQVDGIVYVFHNIGERYEKQKKIEYLSYHDQLTGLYNRSYFESEYNRILKDKRFPLGLIVADLNALKLTNDAFGHQMGDRLIRTFSDILMQNFDEKATVARIGGDEFAILLPETVYEQTVEKIEAIRKSLAESRLEGIPVSASLGFAVHQNELYSFAETFKQADEKMYEQKLVESEIVRKRVIRSIFQQNFLIFPGKKSEVYKALRLAKLFASRLDIEPVEAIRVAKSAMVYDIGNIAIPHEYFVKTDKLNEKEWEAIKTHPAAAYHILKNVIKFADVADIVLSHHENFDGTGYPRGLRGNQIPLESRILALITDYCAMTTSRTYRNKLTMEDALDEIHRNAGVRYDPEFIDLFIETVKESSVE